MNIPFVKIPTPITDQLAQRNKTTTPSKIHPRGWRPYRKPNEFRQSQAQPIENGPNSPVLNEILSNELNVSSNEQRHVFNDPKRLRKQNKKLIAKMDEIEHQDLMFFFNNLTNPPKQLSIPEDPIITSQSSLSIHKEVVPIPITGSAFSIKEMDSIPVISNEDNSYQMLPSI
ncbi:hypothetical protein M9Y10_008341 [Tritrichomonas musculus]|uniref:Uncharacterized protein n=1 Tax=Tritrichomonas musculus TaxID=1915356 RepID=A0ABR2IY57_9EUKA